MYGLDVAIFCRTSSSTRNLLVCGAHHSLVPRGAVSRDLVRREYPSRDRKVSAILNAEESPTYMWECEVVDRRDKIVRQLQLLPYVFSRCPYIAH
jgi:hypothetical protein